jgi:AAA+ ATPase superfamily predicted ATPase
MIKADFIGRDIELELLDKLWNSPKATLLILYGRRRVGKTRLLTHWLQKYPGRALYWVAEPATALEQLRSFSQALYNFATPDAPAPHDFTYGNWEQALRQVALLAQEQRLALFIDEVTYLIDVNTSIMGTFQKAWDQWLSNSNLFLALSGSQMGMMQGEILSHQAPLYGRATAQVKLMPLPFSATKQFFPNYSNVDRVATYSIWGGIPAYWERIDETASVMENIRVHLLPSNALMQEEPRILLQDFINDPHNYVGILRAIAFGAHAQNEICEFTGLSRGFVSKYLAVLRDTGFVERQVPITETSPDSRRGRYYITDPYLRFYYRFLAAYQAKLALGEQQQMLTTIERNLPEFIQTYTWQELCREWVLRASARGEIPLDIEEVGGAWTRTQNIDVVGINNRQKHLVVGSCQWDSSPADLDLIRDLVAKTAVMVPKDEPWALYYLGFASNGWTDDAIKQATKIIQRGLSNKWRFAGVKFLDLDGIVLDLTRWSVSVN